MIIAQVVFLRRAWHALFIAKQKPEPGTGFLQWGILFVLMNWFVWRSRLSLKQCGIRAYELSVPFLDKTFLGEVFNMKPDIPNFANSITWSIADSTMPGCWGCYSPLPPLFSQAIFLQKQLTEKRNEILLATQTSVSKLLKFFASSSQTPAQSLARWRSHIWSLAPLLLISCRRACIAKYFFKRSFRAACFAKIVLLKSVFYCLAAHCSPTGILPWEQRRYQSRPKQF